MKTYKPKHNNRTTRLMRKKRNNNLVSMIKIEMVCFSLIDIQMEGMRLLFIEKYKSVLLWSSMQIFIEKYYLDIHIDTIHFLK